MLHSIPQGQTEATMAEEGQLDAMKQPGDTGSRQSPTGRRGSVFLQTGALNAPGGSSSRRGSINPLMIKRKMSLLRKGTKDKLHMGSAFSLSERSSIAPQVALENTYQMGPSPGQEFKSTDVKKVMTLVLEDALEDKTYNKDTAANLASQLALQLKEVLKQTHCARHKICTYVVVGEACNQGVHIASQCLWAPDTDSYVTVSVRNSSMYAVATAYGLYYE